ncbi:MULTISPECIES: hypothetical protein [unclassified Microcoleus]|uniref:hypothetical protein n=1 Tax=unclassified Microcoleus TaxID=2642155 RepID=UPI00403F839F
MGIYVDDFATGYAAFNTLKNFLVKWLKIDPSLVRDLASVLSERARNCPTHSYNHTGLKCEQNCRRN